MSAAPFSIEQSNLQPPMAARGPRSPPAEEKASNDLVYLGTKRRLPEFILTDKVVLVSGAARGLGLTQAEALLEAGATVYALDRLEEPVLIFPPNHVVLKVIG